MKILIYGAGVIGCTYGWQLRKAGNDITVLVRAEKKQQYKEDGLRIHCSDFREGKKNVIETTFRPRIIDQLRNDNDFEYIIVAVGNEHLGEVLPVLSESAGKAYIVFFQNIWFNDIENIKTYLAPSQYFFGFPFMAGGGKNVNFINAVISGSKYSKTMLGEADGSISPRVNKLADALEKAGMKPFISDKIINWLIPHAAFIAAMSATAIKAGGTINQLLSDKEALKGSVKAIRESFHVCESKEIDPRKEKVNRLYYLPLFICIPIMRKIFSNEDMSGMFDGYLRQSVDEVGMMLGSIMKNGKVCGIAMPYLEDLYKNIS